MRVQTHPHFYALLYLFRLILKRYEEFVFFDLQSEFVLQQDWFNYRYCN